MCVRRNVLATPLLLCVTLKTSGDPSTRAAAQLGVSAPTVSEIIADLEHGIGVRLFDRSKQGVEVTPYGRELLKHTINVFDELKQSIRDIDYLADAGTGELRIGCPDSIATTLLLHIVRRYSDWR